MKVYLVNWSYDYEGTYLCGVFATRELALAYMLRLIRRVPGSRSRRWKKWRDDYWVQGESTVEVEERDVLEQLPKRGE